MRRIPVGCLLLCVLLLAGTSEPVEARGASLSPELQARIAAVPSGETIPVIVQLSLRCDLSPYSGGRETAPALIRDLKATAEAGQRELRDLLRAKGMESESRFLWIVDAVTLRADRALIEEIAQLPGVERVGLDLPIALPDFVTTTSEPGARSLEWNIEMIGGDHVWSDLGLSGAGIVVANMDSGVDITHPALAGKWRGGTNSWFDAINAQLSPYDDNGHGTHTMGIMVGGDGPGPFPDDVGLAYGAQFIAVKVLDSVGGSSLSILLAGFQWILDPDGDPGTDDFPDVVSNSWGVYDLYAYIEFYAAVAAWRAAGIIPVFAIGNGGPYPETTMAPANCNNTIGVGATNMADNIWNSSSRGPSPDDPQYFPADRRKPDLTAPGYNIRSSVPGGGYVTAAGTSFSTPHVAAAIALALESEPGLTFDQLEALLESTAVDRGTPGYDYNFGYGRLDVLAALSQLSALPPVVSAPGMAGISVRPNPHVAGVGFALPALPTTGRLGNSDPNVRIFDAQGQLVRTLGPLASDASVAWDGCDEAGRTMPAGTYFARWSGAGIERTARIVRVR